MGPSQAVKDTKFNTKSRLREGAIRDLLAVGTRVSEDYASFRRDALSILACLLATSSTLTCKSVLGISATFRLLTGKSVVQSKGAPFSAR
jgi:hypothetical protein